ncbi:MAG: YfhO family protein [Gemmatimonadaceae bacterium]|nr:YfhO family protein [Gemmatimonadaceae bacterium]NUQ91931.1 YfhO family protein [Gemmatimonadaceae bacterium]NUR19935.1 YfhO family protein [Gemmatimonadaceae bacterium]
MPRPTSGRANSPLPELREPRFATLIASAVYLVCTLALVYPMLGGAFLVNPSSDYLSGHAYRVFGQQVLRQTGGFAEWNHLLAGGLPFIAGQHGDVFYPTFILREIFAGGTAFNLSIAIHLFLAGLFTYRFLRAWGLGFHSALFGGVAYMLVGQVASLVSPGHDGKLYVSALSPLVLWMIVRAVRDGRLWAFGVLALAGALCIVTPHFQLTYYLALLAGPFAIYVAFAEAPDGTHLPTAVRWRRLAMAAGAGALAAAIAAVHFLPLLEYIPYSPRGAGVSYEYATSYSMPIEETLNAFLPQFSGILENYWGQNPIKLHSDYIGVVTLILAGAAFGAARRKSFVRFWLVAGIVSLLVAWGGHTPFYRLWFMLPKMNVARAPGMIYFITSFALAVLAAVGLERFLTEAPRRRYLIGWAVFAAAVGLLAVAGGLEVMAAGIAQPEKLDILAGNGPAMRLGGLRSLLFAAAAIGVLWSLGARRLSAATGAWILVALAAVDDWSVVRRYFMFSAPASQIYASDPTIEYLQKITTPGRTIVLPVAGPAPGDPILEGDALMIHGVRTVTSHQANEPQRWVDIAGAKSPAFPPNALQSTQFRRLANARFLLVNAELPPIIPQFGNMRLEKRVGPVRDATGSTVWLYEIQEQNPPAWVVPVVAQLPAEVIQQGILDPRIDLNAIALGDSMSGVPMKQVTAVPAALGIGVAVPTYGPGHIVLELDRPAPAGATLVVSENWFPGWTALVDGKMGAVGRVDHTLIGVPLQEGARRIELTFRDPAYIRARPITVVALVLTALLILGGAFAGTRIRV